MTNGLSIFTVFNWFVYKYDWVFPIKDIKGVSIVNAFKTALTKTTASQKKKSNKIPVDQGSKFYNNSFKGFSKINNIKMYFTYHERKSVVAERFIRILKNKIFKHMTAVSKNVYFDVFNDIVDKYNNTAHRTIKMKPLMLQMILILNKMKIQIRKILNL